jgi:hypothetical protein
VLRQALKEPNFFIVGAPKCGTTALFDYLSQHPNTCCPLNKEPNFFATDFPELRGPKTDADYLALFAGASPDETAIGEASVLYFFSTTAVPEIRRRYPAARIIIMLRNPTDMVYSFHSQMLNTVNENEPDFVKAWGLQDARLAGRSIADKCLVPAFLQYRDIGRLSQFIQPVLAAFPAEQVKLIVFDDMKVNPQGVFDEVTDFLDLPRFSGVNFRVVNANRVQRSSAVAGLTERPVNARLRRAATRAKQLLGMEAFAVRKWLAGLNTREAPRPKLAPEFRRELLAFFAEEVTELERLTGRDLSGWRGD